MGSTVYIIDGICKWSEAKTWRIARLPIEAPRLSVSSRVFPSSCTWMAGGD